MEPFARDQIRGTWGTLLLPIAADDAMIWSSLEAEIDALAGAGVDGIYSNGTAGEFYAQSEGEFDLIQEMPTARCERKGVPFQIGVSHTSAQTALERIAAAADPIGIVVYNPPHAKRVLPPSEWLELSRRFPNLVGVKVGGGDSAWYAAMAATGLSVFVPGHQLATGVSRGAAGAYSNVAYLGGCASVGLRLRWPYRSIPESDVQALRGIVRQRLPELFDIQE